MARARAGGERARAWRSTSGVGQPGALALAGADPARGLVERKCGFLVARMGVTSRGAGPRWEVTGCQRRFLFPATWLLPRFPLLRLSGPPRPLSPSFRRLGVFSADARGARRIGRTRGDLGPKRFRSSGRPLPAPITTAARNWGEGSGAAGCPELKGPAEVAWGQSAGPKTQPCSPQYPSQHTEWGWCQSRPLRSRGSLSA